MQLLVTIGQIARGNLTAVQWIHAVQSSSIISRRSQDQRHFLIAVARPRASCMHLTAFIPVMRQVCVLSFFSNISDTVT